MAYPFSKIERKWTKKWLEAGVYEPDLRGSGRSTLRRAQGKKATPFYNLMMFPYPSAEGLHVGNMYAFVGSDIYGRYKRMQGNDVFEPIGLDGFGIHSENYAIKIGTHPAVQAKISEKNFYRQLSSIGNGFAWNERLETYDPEYYKWTQWIFIQLFKQGLAYRKKQAVNWCPSCKTVLADEQVIDAKCERCSTKVIKKELEQWFFKITKYADRLLKGLDGLDWSEKVKIAQRNWIGRSEGALLKFPISDSQFSIEVFTTRPDTIYGATYMVLAPEQPLIQNLEFRIKNLEEVKRYIKKAKAKSEEERIAEGKAKTGVELRGIKSINPATKGEIPVWVADYVLGNVGTGAIMAVPAHDERDFEFAMRYKLPIKEVIRSQTNAHKYADQRRKLQQAYTESGITVNSGRFNGMDSEKAKWEITKLVGGKKKIQYRLRDWLISRQRYWGPPIPVIFCESCKKRLESSKSQITDRKLNKGELENPGWIAVPEKDLPVNLPLIKNFRPTGKGDSPLASVKSFYEVKCPKCGGKARRETDVSDTFLDSAWYFFRYLDKKNKKEPFAKSLAKKWLPVDAYIGGAEHSVLHLLYSRFITMFFKDVKLVDFDEPYSKFRAHGLLISEGAKMSKSKGNVVNPDEYIQKFGADAVRLYLMFIGPFEQGGDWRDAGIMGVVRFLNRIWDLAGKVPMANSEGPRAVSPWMHARMKKITDDIKELKYNTAISGLMVVLNKLEKEKKVNHRDLETFLLLLSPFAPFITEELYQQMRGLARIKDQRGSTQINPRKSAINPRLSALQSIHLQSWPRYDPKHFKEETFILIVQINGKFRAQIAADRGITEKEAQKLALADHRVKQFIEGKKIQKTFFVKDKLINLVI